MSVLGLFFTRGVSLLQWVDSGLFDREVLIYLRHLKNRQFDEIVWFTYGAYDVEVALRLQSQGRLPQQIRVVPMPSRFLKFRRGASLIYTFLMPFFQRSELTRCDVFKTNQMDGALAAVLASRLFKRPLYVRTGYTLSMFVGRVYSYNPFRRVFAWATEKIAFRFCGAASVSSQHDREYVLNRYAFTNEPPHIIGNYVDISRFSPLSNIERKVRVVFVGRLTAQKNLKAAIRAVTSVGIGLDIIGDGPERKKLQTFAGALGGDIRWLGLLSNNELPEVLASYRFFLLPSFWEGMPKVLLEAMAVGVICIGNNAPGIREVIEDGVTGYLSVGPEDGKLAKALQRAIAGDHASVESRARDFVCKNFSLDAVVARERFIFDNLIITSKGKSREEVC
jgi:glycosyltransferase involved in cell wall biosynthesis